MWLKIQNANIQDHLQLIHSLVSLALTIPNYNGTFPFSHKGWNCNYIIKFEPVSTMSELVWFNESFKCNWKKCNENKRIRRTQMLPQHWNFFVWPFQFSESIVLLKTSKTVCPCLFSLFTSIPLVATLPFRGWNQKNQSSPHAAARLCVWFESSRAWLWLTRVVSPVGNQLQSAWLQNLIKNEKRPFAQWFSCPRQRLKPVMSWGT